jgi:hypothetical protein
MYLLHYGICIYSQKGNKKGKIKNNNAHRHHSVEKLRCFPNLSVDSQDMWHRVSLLLTIKEYCAKLK